jgi:hypothetical protein
MSPSPAKPHVSTHPVKARTAESLAILQRVRRICLALPEANERVSHGEPTFFAGKGKVFAMFDDHHHGTDHVAVWLPLPSGAQELLVESDPERFFRPPYVGPSGWVGVRLDRRPDWESVTSLVRDAFLHVATKKLAALVASEAPSGRDVPKAPTAKKPTTKKPTTKKTVAKKPTTKKTVAKNPAVEAASRAKARR